MCDGVPCIFGVRSRSADSSTSDGWRAIVTDPTCPACGEPIEDVSGVGPVTVVFEPCGHQADEGVYRELFEE